MTLKTARIAAFAALGLAVLISAAAYLYWHREGGSSAAPSAGLTAIGGPFTLTDQNGRAVSGQDFRGKLMLVYFGYTFCPDICPIHMATLAAALRELDPAVRNDIRVVFVTVDPERDTPERLAGWMAAFDSSFVGVRGSDEEIAEALAFYRYPPPDRSGDEPGYTVGHPALIYAFTPDNLGRAMYGADTRKNTWVNDLNVLCPRATRPREGCGSGPDK